MLDKNKSYQRPICRDLKIIIIVEEESRAKEMRRTIF
jgi:hypothetical protein